ncbi:carbon storage regulator CsrA [Flagellatimonas centrodinii]|uniref:carbon storage regulator CsrA n=1 Tax=Flagellatimonas centrodinii TaxID=2806210 RepID=UPI001FEFBC2E|nr:carbon storage regulator CsrA [Flagellatimonas centrodinii]ULQ45927.1 carbon storage regulator CsrA [Flagellatimonas centrodinii]
MLIITRRPGESISIGDGIVIRILEIKGNQVRIGCDADKSIEIHRTEIKQRIENSGHAPPAPTR